MDGKEMLNMRYSVDEALDEIKRRGKCSDHRDTGFCDRSRADSFYPKAKGSQKYTFTE